MDDEVEAIVERSPLNVNGGRDVDILLGTTFITLHVTIRWYAWYNHIV